ncbi:MAG: hypothetical protein R3325_05415 [Thermoanaerobaculia bacterium]|nr:hypothetical protein [Thermoanaerobaculia bacterium]
MDAVAPMVVVVGMIVAVGWVIRSFLANRRDVKLYEMRNAMQNRILDKFDSTPELLNFLESPAGQRFAAATVTEKVAYHKRILGSVQIGIIMMVLGVALLSLADHLRDAEEAFLFLGTLGGALGLGFLLAAVAAYLLSRKWGLINGNGESGHGATELPVD